MFKSKSVSNIDGVPTTSTTIIGNGTTIQGNIKSHGDIRIDGTIIGNLEGLAKIIIGANGVVQGDIVGKQADIFGQTIGNIKVEDVLSLHEKANVTGDLIASKLHIEPTALFNGNCKMGANVVELHAEKTINIGAVK